MHNAVDAVIKAILVKQNLDLVFANTKQKSPVSKMI